MNLRGARRGPRGAKMRPSGAKNTQENPRRSPRDAQEEPRGAQERPRGTQETPKRSQKAVLAAIFGVIKRQKSAKMDLRATLVETRAKNKGTNTQTLKNKKHRLLKL